MIILLEVYTKEIDRATFEVIDKDKNLYINPRTVVSMDEKELSMSLSNQIKCYFRQHSTWEYMRMMVYNHG